MLRIEHDPYLRETSMSLFIYHTLFMEDICLMIRFWGQPRYSREPLKPIGYELFLRENLNGLWRVPNDFSRFTPCQITDLLKKTAPQLSQGMQRVSINLDIDQFIDSRFYRAFFAVKTQLPYLRISIELTEHSSSQIISDEQLVLAAKHFADANLHVILDDVGSGDNQINRVELLDPYVTEYKFAVQNFRPYESLNDIMPNLLFWHQLAAKHQKLFTIEGVESKKDLLILSHCRVDMLQGYDLGKPVYLPTQDDAVVVNADRCV